MQQHPYSVLPLAQITRQQIFTPYPATEGTQPFEALKILKDAGVSALLALMPTEELLQNEADLLPEECQLLGIE
jgi:hypothetical protein